MAHAHAHRHAHLDARRAENRRAHGGRARDQRRAAGRDRGRRDPRPTRWRCLPTPGTCSRTWARSRSGCVAARLAGSAPTPARTLRAAAQRGPRRARERRPAGRDRGADRGRRRSARSRIRRTWRGRGAGARSGRAWRATSPRRWVLAAGEREDLNLEGVLRHSAGTRSARSAWSSPGARARRPAGTRPTRWPAS